MNKYLGDGCRHGLVETAGGILSPTPSGSLQADLYRRLRLPAILVGDSKLGGIGSTISAFESLHLRGYDVDSVILFNDPKWENFDYLKKYFSENYGIPSYSLPMPPSIPRPNLKELFARMILAKRVGDPKLGHGLRTDEDAMKVYYDKCSNSTTILNLLNMLDHKHFSRVSKLTSLPARADSIIWHPFRQHALPQNIIAIDSAWRDQFEVYNQDTDPVISQASSQSPSDMSPMATSTNSMTTSLFDASASWWTQGLGHGNPELALAAAHAAGRYGHVMFANAVHQPALDLCYGILDTLENPRLSRVFFTDNGSTGMEVAVKMALRASCQRYGWSKDDQGHPVGILGLKGSYHGDTIGVMNCSEPNTFNEKVDWYKPWGFWFDPPQVHMRKGRWEIEIPESMHDQSPPASPSPLPFESLSSVFDFASRSKDVEFYKSYINRTLKHLTHDQKRRFGALIMEPIIMGAGGMIFVDPLFQRTLITTIRENPSLINPSYTSNTTSDNTPDANDWTGLPLIADEVFTGLYRLGRASSSSFLTSSPSTPSTKLPLDIAPDISVHAKLLTGGLLPLALTTASTSIFNTFLSPSKTDALLHGHSYTAHPIGCAVANKSLKAMKVLHDEDQRWKEHRAAWSTPSEPSASAATPIPTESTSASPVSGLASSTTTGTPSPTNSNSNSSSPFSFFSPTFLTTLSNHKLIETCFALGTVLALTMTPPPTSPSPTTQPPNTNTNTNTSTSASISSSGSGYTSTTTSSLQTRLLLPTLPSTTSTSSPSFAASSPAVPLNLPSGVPSGIHARTLGSVLYIMTSLITTPAEVRVLEEKILKGLDEEFLERESRSQ